TNGFHGVFGVLAVAAGALHNLISFCTPLMEASSATGEPGLIWMAGNSSGVKLVPWPMPLPATGTGAEFRSHTCALPFLYLLMASSPAASCLSRMKYSRRESPLHEVAPKSARSIGPAIRLPLAASYT